jgi:hypothetical protein
MGLKYQQTLLENKKTQSEIDKNNITKLKDTVDLYKNALGSVNDQNAYSAWRANFIKEMPQFAATVPEQFSVEAKRDLILKGDELGKHLTPRFEKVDLGGRVETIDMNPITNPAIKGSKYDKTMTPGEVATDTRSTATLEETVRHNSVIEGQDKFGQPQEVTGPDGKPRLVMQNKKDGTLVDANTRQPIAGIGPKVGEQAQKQQAGVANTVSALQEYRDALRGFSMSDLVNPNARAKMGTVYNNALLQAKEAYNLGVLNGPDYQILQEVLTNPVSLKGGLTSKAALDAQATKLGEIMGRIGQTVTGTQSGITAPQTPAQVSKVLNGKKYVKVNGKWFEAGN